VRTAVLYLCWELRVGAMGLFATAKPVGIAHRTGVATRSTELFATAKPVGVAHGTEVAKRSGGDRGTKARPGLEPKEKERLMLRKRLAVMFIPLVIITGIAGAGAAFAGGPASGRPETSDKAAKLSETFSVLHAVGQWSISLSEMADKKAKSDLVKGYAREVATANTSSDAKLLRLAKKNGIDVGPLDPKTEEGKSLLDRIKAETVLLGSLEGDAFDKEYMTLVTNTQQSAIHFLEASKASAGEQEVKQFFGDLTTTVQSRLKTAQDIMAKVYGDKM
jgi:predicted outer membrane protein